MEPGVQPKHHRLRFAAHKRGNAIRADGERKVGRPFSPRWMHEAGQSRSRHCR
jgi:hypothetical protein